MDGLDQDQQLGIRQPLTIGCAATLAGSAATHTDVQDGTQLAKGKLIAMRIDPGVPHSASLAKYAVAFRRMSFSRFSRAFSARRPDSSICSGVTFAAPAPLSLPASNCFTQLRSVCSTKPISLATAPTLLPSLTRLTACYLSSAVYSRFGIFCIFVSSVTDSLRHPWKTKFQGNLNAAHDIGLS